MTNDCETVYYSFFSLFGVRCWCLTHYSLCLHQSGFNKWKVKISSKGFDFCSYNCDPDKWKRSFPSFVDKLPNKLPVFSSLLDTNFPRTMCTAKAPTSFSYGHFTCDATEERVSCGWFNLLHLIKPKLKQNEAQFNKKGVNAAYMAGNAEQMKRLQV